MGKYRYKKIDAFTSGQSTGNPAACIYLNSGQNLPEEEMQSIATQHKGSASEVIYCRKEQSDRYYLRYYSSECEVDFCGHGTIACIYDLISSTPELLPIQELEIDTAQKDILKVYNYIQQEDAVYITAPDVCFPKIDVPSAEIISQNLGISLDQIRYDLPVQIINAGLNTLIVGIQKLSDIIRIFPDEAKLKTFCLTSGIDIILIFCLETADPKNVVHTRVFAPKFGYLEDPATGSGNSALGHYMLQQGLWNRSDISIEQGGKDRIYNTVKLKFHGNKLLFGGCATTRIEGYYLS